MKDSKVIVVAVLVTVALAVLLYLSSDKKYMWYENYRTSSDQPYGALLLKKLLEEYQRDGEFTINSRKPVKQLLVDVEPENTSYVFIGSSIFLDDESILSLGEFLDEGGEALIASWEPPADILQSVYFEECGASVDYESVKLEVARMNFFHDNLKLKRDAPYKFRVGTNDVPYYWGYISDSTFCESTRNITPLGYFDNRHVNFVRIKVGKGNLFLHSNPIVFTNYFLTDRLRADYAATVLSHLDGRDIIWDEFSRVDLRNEDEYYSPLYYILEQPSLKYAWWLLLATVAIYAFFGAKRRQRIIPLLEPKTNTSLEFVKLIARLHFKNGNHLDMAHKKMRYFLYFVRSKYGIHAERFGEEQMKRLAIKARVDLLDVQTIFARYYLIEERFRNNIEANRMVDLYESIENFYRKCK
jgi:hypothetical protein